MTQRAPVRQAPLGAATEPAIRDAQEQAELERFVVLRVTANQALAPSGARIFDVAGPQKTDELRLKAGVPNLVPHGLDRPVRHAALTLLGDARWWLEAPPAGFDERRVVAIRVSSDVTARARVRG